MFRFVKSRVKFYLRTFRSREFKERLPGCKIVLIFLCRSSKFVFEIFKPMCFLTILLQGVLAVIYVGYACLVENMQRLIH